jgi:hypothetical protein
VKTVMEFHILLGTRNFRVSLAGVHFSRRTPLHGAYPFSEFVNEYNTAV